MFLPQHIKTFPLCVSSVPPSSVAYELKISLSISPKKVFNSENNAEIPLLYNMVDRGGEVMKVEMVRKTTREILFLVEDRYEVYAGGGSVRHRIIEHLASKGNVFVTRHIADALGVKAKDDQT